MGVRRRISNDEADVAGVAAALLTPLGIAPTIDCRWDYYLLAPGHGPGYDLVNPRCKISPNCSSYPLIIGRNKVQVKVLLNKKAFEIKDSPPVTAECKCSVKQNGKLTVGWRGDIKNAWRIVLGVLGIAEDATPIAETPDGSTSLEIVCTTVAKKVCEASPTSSYRNFCSSIAEMGHEELQTASQILKDRILRSDLCKQPVSTNKADALLVDRKRRIDEIDSQYVGLTSKSST